MKVRIVDFGAWSFKGDMTMDSATGLWMMACYKCGHTASLGGHKVTVNGGAVTVEPSIVCPHEGCGAHYNVANSEIQPC